MIFTLKTNTMKNDLTPNNEQLEKEVLSAVIKSADTLDEVVDILNIDLFYYPNHALIYEAIDSLLRNNAPIDIRTVRNELIKQDSFKTIGGQKFLSAITKTETTFYNVKSYILALKELDIRRKTIESGQNAIKLSADSTNDCFDTLDTVQGELERIGSENTKSNSVPFADAFIESTQRLEDIVSGKVPPYVETGLRDLDRKLKTGKGELIVLAARPAMGKTALCLQISYNISLDEPVAFFSLEMTKTELSGRLIASGAEVNADRIREPKTLTADDWERIADYSNIATKNDNLIINDDSSIGLVRIKAECRKIKKKKGSLGLIVIDYLNLMTNKQEGGGNREQEIASITRSLKRMAKSLNAPILLLAQLSRAVETRGGDKRPILSDLRESGSIEQDADSVLFLYRPEYYGIEQDEEGQSTKGLMEIIIAKSRHSATGIAIQKFEGQYQRISEYQQNDFPEFNPKIPVSAINRDVDLSAERY